MHAKREKNLRESAAFLLFALGAVVVGLLMGGEGGQVLVTIAALAGVITLAFAGSELMRSR